MTISDIRTRLHDEIDQSDGHLLKLIYAFVQEYHNDEPGNTDELREQLVLKEREDHFNGRGISYSWEDVKKMAVNKQRPHDL